MSFAAPLYPKVERRASLEITPSFFAEFLELSSLALLSLLDLTTCVGYRYDLINISLRSFSRMLKSSKIKVPKNSNPITPQVYPPEGGSVFPDLPRKTTLVLRCNIHRCTWIIQHRPSPDQTILTKDRNINR